MWLWVDEQFVDDMEKWLPLNALSMQYGYAVFETIRVTEGELMYFNAHYERLLAGCQAILLHLPYPQTILKEFCWQVCQKNKMEHGVIKISCFKHAQKDSVMISCRNNPYGEKNFLEGFHVKISQYKRNPYSRLVGIKTNNYLENYLERQAALQEGFHEVLFLNTNGVMSECSASNIFFVKNLQLYTPSLHTGILPGIMRAVVIKKAEKAEILVKEGEFDRTFLTTVEGAFLTNSIMEAMPVSRIKDEQDLDMLLNVEMVHILLLKLLPAMRRAHG